VKYLFFLFLPVYIFGLDIYNGEIKIISLDEKPEKVFFEKKEILPFRLKNHFFVIVSAGYRETGDKQLFIVYKERKKKVVLHVKKRGYKKESLKVSEKKVHPPKEVLNRIYKEYKEAQKIYSSVTHNIYWDEPFLYPLDSKITSEYGTARVFNGVLKSFHSGTDFRAKMKTPVKASNKGVVVISKNRYYAGGSVVIDHGGGVYSCYYHLNKIYKETGDVVKRGEIIGLSGKSGRVTGPHLHFGIVVYGKTVNPLKFIENIKDIYKSFSF